MDVSESHRGDILIVDDESASQRVLVRMLSRYGYRAQSFSSGSLAVSAAQAFPPDLILLDVRMPRMDGYAVCEQLKGDARTRDIPIIFMSALDDTEDKLKAFTAGGIDYVTKPFQLEEVLARVETHLALREANQGLADKNALLEREIAERRRIEAELERYRDQLEERVQVRTAELQAEIAERQRIERALRTSEAEFRTIYETASAIILAHDLQNRIVYMNP